MQLILFLMVFIPVFVLFWKVMMSGILKEAEKAISDGYKGIRLPLFKYDKLITAVNGYGERGNKLATELRMVRDNKISTRNQLNKELEEIGYD